MWLHSFIITLVYCSLSVLYCCSHTFLLLQHLCHMFSLLLLYSFFFFPVHFLIFLSSFSLIQHCFVSGMFHASPGSSRSYEVQVVPEHFWLQGLSLALQIHVSSAFCAVVFSGHQCASHLSLYCMLLFNALNLCFPVPQMLAHSLHALQRLQNACCSLFVSAFFAAALALKAFPWNCFMSPFLCVHRWLLSSLVFC